MAALVLACKYDDRSSDHRYDHKYSDILACSLVVESCSNDHRRGDGQWTKSQPPGRVSPSTHGYHVPRVHSWMDTVGDALHC